MAYFCMAAGAFSCLAAASCLLLRQLTDPRVEGRRLRWLLIASLVGLAIVEIALTPREKPTGFTGQTALGFVVALYHVLSFPTRAAAVFIWFPFAALLAFCWIDRRKVAPTSSHCFVAGLGVFVLLTAAGIAFQRGDAVASRYTDILWLSCLRRLADLLLRQAWTILAFGLAALLACIVFASPKDELPAT